MVVKSILHYTCVRLGLYLDGEIFILCLYYACTMNEDLFFKCSCYSPFVFFSMVDGDGGALYMHDDGGILYIHIPVNFMFQHGDHPPSTIHHRFYRTIHHGDFWISDGHHPPSTIHHPPSTIHHRLWPMVAHQRIAEMTMI
jgi:hypothetical protein